MTFPKSEVSCENKLCANYILQNRRSREADPLWYERQDLGERC